MGVMVQHLDTGNMPPFGQLFAQAMADIAGMRINRQRAGAKR